MVNMTSRLAVRIKNVLPGSINWSDKSPQGSRSSLKAEDIPNEEDGEVMSKRAHHEVLGWHLQGFEASRESGTQTTPSSSSEQVIGGTNEDPGCG